MYRKVLIAGLAVATLAMAQMGGGGQDPGSGGIGTIGATGKETGGGSATPNPMRAPKETPAELMIARLKLNKDQQSQFLSILEATQKDAMPVIQLVMKGRQEYANALLVGKTGADLDPFLKAMNETQFAMTGIEVKAFQRVMGILKPNQAAKAPEAFDLMADIFIPTAGGGAGMRRGGGR